MVILLRQLGRANEHSEPSGVGVYSRLSVAIMLCVGTTFVMCREEEPWTSEPPHASRRRLYDPSLAE
jgi:hypothetical protein